MPPIGGSARWSDPRVQGLSITIATVGRISSVRWAAPVSASEKRWAAGTRQSAAAGARSSTMRTEWGPPAFRTLNLRLAALGALVGLQSGDQERSSPITVQR